MKPMAFVAAGVLVPLLGGCVAPEALYASAMRHGKVVRIYSLADAEQADAPRCLVTGDPADVAAGRYVLVRYRRGRGEFSTVAIAPPKATPSIGQQLEVELADCARGTPSRVVRLLDGDGIPP